MMIDQQAIQLQRGVSMTEAMMILVVVAGLAVAITVTYEKLSARELISNAIDMIDEIREAGEVYVQSRESYPPNIASLVSEGLLASNYSATTANPWGGGFTVLGKTALTGEGMYFEITLSRVPNQACQQLTEHYQQYAHAIGNCTSAETFIVEFE